MDTADLGEEEHVIDHSEGGAEVNANSAPPPNENEASSPPLPGSRRKRKTRVSSEVWNHFTKIESKSNDDGPRCACNYYGADYACDSRKCGTSTLWGHLNNQCRKYSGGLHFPDKKLSFESEIDGGRGNLVARGCTKTECKAACAKMVIVDELPFKFVEGVGFRNFCSVLNPHFSPPSRRTLVRDIHQLYLDERKALKNYFSHHHQRVSLTTDTWTSIQNINYMSLTAHYIDSDWNLQKRILNFCVIANHKGETIGKLIGACLHDWGIDKVFTITVDNASSNDTAISYLKKQMNGWEDKRDACVLNENFLHMRCCAHIVNLIVCEGLKEAHDSIVCIRNAVKFVKSSPARFEKLKECAALEKIESKSLVFLDVPTRWNSTYLMLEAAIKFQKAFDKLLEEDIHYVTYFQDDEGGRRSGPPTDTDWENATVFVKFLKNFYNVTLNFSASLHVTSCSYLDQVCTLVAEIEWANTHDLLLCGMARNMKKKLDKYWGRMDEVNQVLLVC